METSPSSPPSPNPLISAFGAHKVWINWTKEPAKNTDGSPKLLADGSPYYTKIPRRVDGGFASVSDPKSWSLYEQALKAKENYDVYKKYLDSTGGRIYSEVSPRPQIDGIGIVFAPSLNLVGIDLDKYWVANGGKLSDPSVMEFISSAHTYIEKSPSKTGAHIFFQLPPEEWEIFDPIVKKHHNESNPSQVIEIYSRGRYFTFTGDTGPSHGLGEANDLRVVSIEELNALLGILGYPWGKSAEPWGKSLGTPAESVFFDQEILDGLNKLKELSGGGAKEVKVVEVKEAGMEDEALLQKMWAAKNGAKIRSLYEGDLSSAGGDHSSADMALCSHLAFWTGKDYETIKRIWLASPLGKREKTQKRKDYVDRTIKNAIENCKDVYLAAAEVPEGPPLDQGDLGIPFICNRKGTPELITANIVRVLEHDPDFMGLFRLNSFSKMIECKNDSGAWINMVDKFVLRAQTRISEKYPPFVKLSKAMMEDAIKLSAAEHSVNPPVDWLRSLKWDGEERLNHWLYKVYGTPDDDLHQSMGSNFLKGMVNRITSPGCQMDLVLCLEGPQGTKKSSSLRVLGGKWFAENVTTVDSKDDLILFAGNILVEFSEGAVLSAYSVTKLKSVITATIDKFRPPYEHGLVDFPRGCVFSLSTNDTTYLKDDTGGRRFLIVKLGKVADVSWLSENRDQLFAEALHRVENGETTYEFSEGAQEELRELQESRTEGSAYSDVIQDWYLGRSKDVQEKGITALDAYLGAINTDGNREMSPKMEKSICSILRGTLHLENRQFSPDENGKRPRRWVPTGKTRKAFRLAEEQGRTSSVDGVDEFNKFNNYEKPPEEE